MSDIQLLRKEPLEPNANTVVIVDAGSASAAKFQERGITVMTRDELRALVQQFVNQYSYVLAFNV